MKRKFIKSRYVIFLGEGLMSLQSTHHQEPVQQVTEQSQLPRTLAWVGEALKIETNQDLKTVLNVGSVKMLTWLGMNKSEQYSTFSIRKRDGTFRNLHNPSPVMRSVQYKILRNILDNVHVPDYIFAFERDKSIPKMAQMHVGKKIVVSIDIKDFFHSIKQNSVYDLLTGLGFGPKPARTVSEICTFKAFVPQGALTSPKISNLVAASTFGPILKSYCDSNGLTLTIYADDITISSADRETHVSEIISVVTSAVTSFGFKVNRSKTKVMTRSSRQYVCGAVVNEKVNLVKKERQRLRAIVHNTIRNGLVEETSYRGVDKDKFVSHIMGKLNWFSQLNPVQGTALKDKFKDYLATLETNTTTLETTALEKTDVEA